MVRFKFRIAGRFPRFQLTRTPGCWLIDSDRHTYNEDTASSQSNVKMSNKGERQPLVNNNTVRESPPWSPWRFFIGLGLCFLLLSASWHAFSYFSVAPWHVALTVGTN